MTTDLERRNDPLGRIDIQVPVELGHGSFDDSFEADSVNLSTGGLSMRSPCLPDVGSELLCRFHTLPAGAELVVAGHVVWTRIEGERSGEFGIAFIDLDPCTEGLLEEMVAEHMQQPRSADGAVNRPMALATLDLEGGGRISGRVVPGVAGQLVTFEQDLDLLKLGGLVRARAEGEDAKQGAIRSVEIKLVGNTPMLSVTVDLGDEEPMFGEFEWSLFGELPSPADTTPDLPAPTREALADSGDEVADEVDPPVEAPVEAFVEAEPEAVVEAEPEAVVEAEPEAVIEAEPEPEQPALTEAEPAPEEEALPAVLGRSEITLTEFPSPAASVAPAPAAEPGAVRVLTGVAVESEPEESWPDEDGEDFMDGAGEGDALELDTAPYEGYPDEADMRPSLQWSDAPTLAEPGEYAERAEYAEPAESSQYTEPAGYGDESEADGAWEGRSTGAVIETVEDGYDDDAFVDGPELDAEDPSVDEGSDADGAPEIEAASDDRQASDAEEACDADGGTDAGEGEQVADAGEQSVGVQGTRALEALSAFVSATRPRVRAGVFRLWNAAGPKARHLFAAAMAFVLGLWVRKFAPAWSATRRVISQRLSRRKRRTTAVPAMAARQVPGRRREARRSLFLPVVIGALGFGAAALGAYAFGPLGAEPPPELHRAIARTPDNAKPKKKKKKKLAPAPAPEAVAVEPTNPYAAAVAPTAAPTMPSEPAFGAADVPNARRFTLRMSAPVRSLKGIADRGGFTIIVPGSLSLDRAGPIGASHGRVVRSMILNKGDRSELTIRFRDGEKPAYRVIGKGAALEVLIES